MLKHIFLILFFISGMFNENIIAQSFVSRWQYSWGGGRQDFLNTMIPIPGNSYFFAGTSASPVNCNKTSVLYGEEDFAVFMMDDAGNKIWEKTYGGDSHDVLKAAIKVSSGGYILTGETSSGVSGIKTSPNNGVADFWIIKIDDNGNLLWEKTYGGTDFEIGVKILETPEGGYLVAGISSSNQPGYNHGSSDYQLLKIDASGNLLWSKLYGGVDGDQLHDLVAGSDGNYFLSGISSSQISGNKTSPPIGGFDVWVIKVSPDGTKIWDKTYGTAANETRGTLLSLLDGNILVIESSLSTGRIRKIDINGNQIWQQTCTGNSDDEFQLATQDANTGNIYVAGSSNTNNFGCKTSTFNGGGWFGDIWITIFDAAGNKIDDLDFGGNDADFAIDIDFVNDDIWVSGWSNSPLSGNKTTNNCGISADGWIIRLSKKFYINNKTISAICNTQTSFKVHFTTTVDFMPNNVFTVQLSDMNGSFLSPVNIGSINAKKSDSIIVTLPVGLPLSQNYKLRIVSTQQTDTSSMYSLWIHGLPLVNLGNDTNICQNTTLILNAGIQAPNSLYLWNTGSTNNSITINTPGIYWCEVKNSCGIKRDSIQVEVKVKPAINIGPDTSFCAGSTIILQSGLQLPNTDFLWNNGSTTSTTAIQEGGIYWLKVSNACGIASDTLFATKNPLPVINLDKNNFLCQGTNRALNAGSGYKNYLWNDGSTFSTLLVSNTGVYFVKVTDNNSCIGSDTVRIIRMTIPPSKFLSSDTTICSYGFISIKPSTDFKSYLWSNGGIENSITAKQAGLYWLEVKDEDGCTGRDTLLLMTTSCPNGFYVPTAFTPNNDGVNDFFKPVIFGDIKSYSFTIYNRYGEIVFRSTDPMKSWEGTYKEMRQNSTVFTWTCTYQLEGDPVRSAKGSVVLIR